MAWRHAGRTTWGVEAVMLAAGTNVQWLRDDLGLIASSDESHEIAASCADTGGVVFVPAPLGLGTPEWDYGARGALFGLTRGTGRAEIVRAVLEGIAHRGADLVDAAEADTGTTIPRVRVDGGMTDNPTFVQALADATQRPVEISPVREATALGAALLAGVAVGHHASIDALATTWNPKATIEPSGVLDRDQWRDAVDPLAALDPRALGDRLLTAPISQRQRPAVASMIAADVERGLTLVGQLRARLACRATPPRCRRAPPGASARGTPGRERHGQAVDRVGDRRRAHPLGVLRALLHRRDRPHAEHDLARAEHAGQHPGRRCRRVPAEEDAQHHAGQDAASRGP